MGANSTLLVEGILRVFGLLGVMLMLSFIIETLVEAVLGKPMESIPALAPYKWLLRYVAIAVGLGGALTYRLDIIYLLGAFAESLADHPGLLGIEVTTYGIIITGVSLGQGSTYIHDLIKRFFNRGNVTPGPDSGV